MKTKEDNRKEAKDAIMPVDSDVESAVRLTPVGTPLGGNALLGRMGVINVMFPLPFVP
jgi:hypothetical protein